VELQDYRPEHAIPLELVGFRGVRRRIRIESPAGPIELDVSLDVYVSIGPERRGAHLSRHVEAVDSAASHYGSLEDYVESVARELLRRHSYADKVRAAARTVYHVEVEFAGIRGREPVEAQVEVTLDRGGRAERRVAVTVAALTVCPSAQATVAEWLGYERLPAPSHVQRVLVTGRVETRGEMVRIEEVARALWGAASAPAFTLLKRADEARLVVEAHRRPRFAEDVARHAAVALARLLSGRLPGDSTVEVEVVSLESIHPHDVYALARGTLDAVLAAYRDLDV